MAIGLNILCNYEESAIVFRWAKNLSPVNLTECCCTFLCWLFVFLEMVWWEFVYFLFCGRAKFIVAVGVVGIYASSSHLSNFQLSIISSLRTFLGNFNFIVGNTKNFYVCSFHSSCAVTFDEACIGCNVCIRRLQCLFSRIYFKNNFLGDEIVFR